MKLNKRISVSEKTLERLNSITYVSETHDEIINKLFDWALGDGDNDDFHRRIQA